MSDPSDTPADAAPTPRPLPQSSMPERRSSGRFLPLLSLLLTVGLAALVWQQQVTLRSLSLGGLPVRVREALRMPQVEMADASVPALQAGFDTPLGSVTLTSNP